MFTIHLVLDNLNIHRREPLTDLLGEEAEIEIGLLSRQCLRKRQIPNPQTLAKEVCAWNLETNRRGTRINWTFDLKAARRKFKYERKSSRLL